MKDSTVFKTFSVAFVIMWVLSILASLGITGLVLYILYRLAVILS